MAEDTDRARPTVTQFTDPMCTWCWGSEPVVRRLRVAFGDRLDVEYVMGGLVEDFDQFYDAGNDVGSPADVAPHWESASEQHGMPVDTSVFEANPPRSTYPASVAFAAARLVDEDRAGRYLRLLREGFATRNRNVNDREAQVSLAEDAGLDTDAFVAALEDGRAREAFEDDLAETRATGVRAFPTYAVSGPAGTETATGFQRFDDLVGLLDAVGADLDPSSPPPVEQFVDEFGPVATQEVAEVYELVPAKARQTLASLADRGRVESERRGDGLFWRTAGGRRATAEGGR
jgi:predicted DsbA family dithiol-disulfide isomerase